MPLVTFTTFDKVNENPPHTLEDYDKPAPRPGMNFGPGMKVWLLFALYFSFFLALNFLAEHVAAFAWMNAGAKSGYPVYYARISQSLQSIFMFAIPAIVFANIFPMERFGWFQLGKKVRPVYVALGVLAMLFAIFGFGQIETWCYDLITNSELKSALDTAAEDANWYTSMPTIGDLFFCLIVNAFLPALCEELFFRAGLQQLFNEWTRKPHLSVFISAFIFAVLHLNPITFPFDLLAGLMLGYAFYWTGSLRINVMMHFMFNASSLIIDYCNQHNSAFAAWNPSVTFSMGGLVLSAGFMFLLWKKTRKLQV